MSSKTSSKTSSKPNSNRWVFPAVIVGLFVIGVIAVIVVASSGGDDDASKGPKATTEVAPTVTVSGTALPDYTGQGKDSAVGMAAPTLTSVDFQGNPVEAGGATGSPYALVFLAHWCPHCQAEVPRLVAAGKAGKIAGVDVTGVLTGTSSANPNYPPSEWLAREDWDFGVLLDDAKFDAAQAYGLSSYPFLVLVDANGKVVGRTSGEIPEDDLTEIFTALAKGQPLPIPGVGGSSSAG